MTETEIPLNNVDSTFDNCQTVVARSQSVVGVQAHSDHPEVHRGQQMVEEVLPVGRLEMSAIQLEHAGVHGVQWKQMQVGRDRASGGAKGLIHGRKLVVVPVGAGAALRRSKKELQEDIKIKITDTSKIEMNK